MATKKATTETSKANEFEGTQLLPTPEIGTIVRYYPKDMDMDDWVAALVTRVEAPGQVQLEIHSPSRQPFFKQGVHWTGDDRRLAPTRPFRANGCWEFMPKQADPLRFHRDLLIKKKKAAEAAEEAREKEAERKQRTHEEKRDVQAQIG